MTSRTIRDGFLGSERVAKLSPKAERLYVRMLLFSDDAGRLDGRPGALHAGCFPVGGVDVETAEFGELLTEIIGAELAIGYRFDEKPYLQILRVQRIGNAKRAIFPWTDGGFTITYITRETADGSKDYVFTSLPGAELPATPPRPVQEPASQAAYRIAQALAESIRSWRPEYREINAARLNGTVDQWSKDIDLAIRKDKRNHGEMLSIVTWLPDHQGSGDFRWRNNILSGSKLREQYDKLAVAWDRDVQRAKLPPLTGSNYSGSRTPVTPAVDNRPSIAELHRGIVK